MILGALPLCAKQMCTMCLYNLGGQGVAVWWRRPYLGRPADPPKHYFVNLLILRKAIGPKPQWKTYKSFHFFMFVSSGQHLTSAVWRALLYLLSILYVVSNQFICWNGLTCKKGVAGSYRMGHHVGDKKDANRFMARGCRGQEFMSLWKCSSAPFTKKFKSCLK